jgi:hypothetical protein
VLFEWVLTPDSRIFCSVVHSAAQPRPGALCVLKQSLTTVLVLQKHCDRLLL